MASRHGRRVVGTINAEAMSPRTESYGILKMSPSVPIADVTRIEVFTQSAGFASPPLRVAKLDLVPGADGFLRETLPEERRDLIPAERVARVLAALSRPRVAKLDPALFDVPEAVIERHYGSMWTDDYPGHLVRVTLSTDRIITIRSEAQHTFMLPLKVTDSQGGSDYETFDPNLGRAIADLMPDGYLDRDRLGGSGGMLSCHLEESARESDRTVSESDPPPRDDAPPGGSRTLDETMNEIYRILSGVESPEEKAAAEAAGRLSERLLKRISAREARDLIARGTDPNAADDAGQTALMHAAFPPFDREKFQVLVDAGANLDTPRKDGLTGLHLACAGGEAATASAWIESGADVNAGTPEGTTPLMLASNLPEIARLLLASGADVNAADADGHTALVYAILDQSAYQPGCKVETIPALISAGADVNLRDRDARTPLAHAQQVVRRVQLEEEVCRAFNPAAVMTESYWAEQLRAAMISRMIAAAGGRA